MSGSQLVLMVSSAAFLVASGLVGVRLLWQAQRIRQLPEFLMGSGLVCVILIYLPLMGWTGVGRVPAGEVKIGVLALASIFMWFGFTCLISFTYQTFRADRAWAMCLTLAMSSLIAAGCAGMLASLMASSPETPSFVAAKFWTGLIRVPMIVSFAWTAFEGLHNFLKCRRREALGLSDPIVTNRFLLWAIVGAVQTSINLVSLALHTRGVGIMASPTALFIVALGGFSGSVLMILTFLPPASYLNFLRNRASGQEI